MSRKIVILGAGESGVGSAILARKQGYDVFISDAGTIKEKYREMILQEGFAFEEGTHTVDRILNADEIIKSPGIPEKAEIMKAIRGNHIPVISEIEFAGRFCHAKTICITGSNGKTTTTCLVHHMLTKAGFKAGLAGNVGHSFAAMVASQEFDYYVIELSSFQLDDMFHFRPDIAILLNITPDHLDRYNYEFQNYVDSKFRITHNLDRDTAFIYCADDDIIMKELQKRNINATMLPFSIRSKVENGGFCDEKNFTINYNNNPFTMSIQELALQGRHNQYNSLAAGIAAHVLKIRKDLIRESLIDFQAVEHRLEKVLKIHGVEFINDSKATNVNSTWYALESMKKPVVWIVGGVDKGNDYNELTHLVKEKVKAIVCLGTDNSKIVKAFEGLEIPITETQNMHDAIKSSYYLAKEGDIVLLSPACASFDLFESYEDRGKQFKRAVRDL